MGSAAIGNTVDRRFRRSLTCLRNVAAFLSGSFLTTRSCDDQSGAMVFPIRRIDGMSAASLSFAMADQHRGQSEGGVRGQNDFRGDAASHGNRSGRTGQYSYRRIRSAACLAWPTRPGYLRPKAASCWSSCERRQTNATRRRPRHAAAPTTAATVDGHRRRPVPVQPQPHAVECGI